MVRSIEVFGFCFKRQIFISVMILVGTSVSWALVPIQINGTFWFSPDVLDPSQYDGLSASFGRLSDEQMDRLEQEDVPVDEAVINILEEARWIFSGMIYGFIFSYTPNDVSLQVAESFSLIPKALIDYGDPYLRINSISTEGSLIRMELSYELSDTQQKRQELLKLSNRHLAQGKGTGSLLNNSAGRREAVENAIRLAVRAGARRLLVGQKPRRIEGELVLRDVPIIGVDRGRFRASVQINFRAEQVTPHFIP
jgi:hypothetical protein